MSSLVKLSISGVRSYDNRGRETLQFSKPLTLIAGPNGVGKTTIIEALKYATTGDMPPNSRGGAFVHDPKMSGERQVLGQVKLGYYNARGQQMVVTRSMQLTQNKKASTFKTLDGQLLIVVDGVKETLSSRCADLDVQVPLSLGVSTPVLDYVIFCHQEDSMWPLSEPSLVKKRFDEIFEATKYSKALDAIKTLKKDYTSDIKLQQQTVEYLHQDNERATKMARQIDQLTVRIQNLNAEADQTKREMDATTSQLNKLFRKNQDFQKVISELNQSRHTATELESHIQVIKNDLEILDDSTASIEQKLANFDADESKIQLYAQGLRDKQLQLTQSLQKSRDSLAQLTRQRGVLENEKQTFDRHKAQFEEILESIISYYKVNTNESEISDFLEERIQAAQNQYSEYQSSMRIELAGVQKTIDEYNHEISNIKHHISTFNDQIAANEDEVKKLTLELQQHASSGAGGNKKYNESQLDDLQQHLNQLNDSLANEQYPEKIDAASQSIASLKQRQDQTNRDLIKASSRFNENSRIMVQKDNLSKKRYHISDLEDMLVTELVAVGKPGKAIVKELKEYESELESERQALANKSSELAAENQQYDANLKLYTQEKADLTKKIQAINKKMESEGIHLPGFHDTLKEVEEDLEIATQNLEQTTFSTQYYETAKTQAEENSKCILCQHEFNKSELSSFLELISAKISSIPITKEDAAASFEETRKEAEKLRSLVSEYSSWTSLTQRLPEVESKLVSIGKQRQEIGTEIAGVKEQMAAIQAKINTLKPLSANVGELERLEKDAAQLEQEINEAVSSSVIDDETPQQVQDRLEIVNSDLKNAELQLSRLKDAFQSKRDEVSECMNKISKKQLDLKNLELKEQSVEASKRRIEDLKTLNREIEGKIPANQEKLSQVVGQCNQVIEQQKRLNEEKSTKEKQLLEERSTAERFSNKVAPLLAELEDFDDQKLQQLATEVTGAEQQLRQMEHQLEELAGTIQQNDRKIVDSRGQKRLLQDNIQLRSYEVQLANTKAKIIELEGQGAENEKDEFERQSSLLQNDLSELSSNHSLKLGQVKSLEEQKQGLESDLRSDFADIHQKYYTASTRLDCTKNATEDLQKYTKALDGAIMMYHSIKMEEINQVLDELWKDTYMGTDIDTIKIKSETESTKTRTTHNYRVVMYKQGVELDMRGRCSAGQKLLACVLIRLALSECFGINCGFLVLDEPTTNLDVVNIQSLGRSLSRIIETRRAQKNFQLIVITHDEHFLTCLGASNFCDTFFRLYRDSHQHSKIEELPITQLG